MSQPQTKPEPIKWHCQVCQNIAFNIAVTPECKIIIKCSCCGYINKPTWQVATQTNPYGKAI